ncbi:YDG/SRA domain-containing protein [Halopolyspora algeriensis]|uniref:YDG/SRA domain-containing protein n=1 Tax=Halopolyspora algeriensis TaxID=1500506 RepID=UPI000DF4AE6C
MIKPPHAPATGYRYGGLFRVESAWREAGRSGFQVCRYRLTQLDTTVLSPENRPPLARPRVDQMATTPPPDVPQRHNGSYGRPW